MTKKELTAKARSLGLRIPRGMTYEDIQKNIDLREKENAALAKYEADREAERQADLEARNKRICDRGELAAFIKRLWTIDYRENPGEGEYCRLMRWAVETVDGFPEVQKKFQDQVSENPFYTMENSRGFFADCARYRIAKELVDSYHRGPSWADVEEHLLNHIRRSSYGYSSSESQNLMYTMMVRVAAELIHQ